jgi:hypothetical protein
MARAIFERAKIPAVRIAPDRRPAWRILCTASKNVTASKASFDFEAEDIAVSSLLLDPNNYSFLDRRKFKKGAARFHE